MPSDKLTRQYKKVADAAALPMKADREFYTNLGFQNKCAFEIMLLPEVTYTSDISRAASTTRQLLGAPKDIFIGRYYLYSIQELPLTGYEYVRYGGLQGVKDMIYPESFTATFLEDNIGSVKAFFRNWMDKIAVYDPIRKDYVFNDDQSLSKKQAIIMPVQSDALPSTEWIKIDGMKIKAITGIGYDHASGENEIITAEFACDTIRLIGLSLGDLL
jgi:hypothetical protein